MRWAEFAAGVMVVVSATISVLCTAAGSSGLLTGLAPTVRRLVEAVGFGTGRHLPAMLRHHVLRMVAPASIIATLITWLALYLGGYSLVLRPFVGGGPGRAVRLAGSSLSLLGFQRPSGVPATVIAIMTAATVPLLAIVELAYLPSLFAAYRRREQAVTLLASRVGGILTGDAVLLAHTDWASGLEDLCTLWEGWSADVMETHGRYPVLCAFRSHDQSSPWVYALLAVLDAAALHTALGITPQGSPATTRLLDIGQRCVEVVTAGTVRRSVPVIPARQGLEHLDLKALTVQLKAAGLPVTAEADSAWQQLCDRRRDYAGRLDDLGRRLGYDLPVRDCGTEG